MTEVHFGGFSRSEPTPERTTFVRFRKALVAQGLHKRLFDEITAQLKAKAMKVKTGSLVDATIVAPASAGDADGHGGKHRGKTAVHGYKAHVVADTGLFATQTGVFRNGIPLADDAVTIAKTFATNGYSTGCIGKWHFGGSDPVPRTERGGSQS